MSYNGLTKKVIAALGFKNEKLPVQGMPETRVLGLTVWVNELAPKPRRFELRLYCRCPDCHKTLPVGRLEQHHKFCPKYEQPMTSEERGDDYYDRN